MPADKTRERMKGAATAVQAKHGNNCSTKKVQVGRTSSTSFGVKAEPPALPCRDDILVENGAVAPKSCLSPLEMRTLTAAGGLLPTDKAYTATRTSFDQPSLWFCPTEAINLRTSIQYASFYSSFWRIDNLLAAPSCRRVIETKLGQNLVFDPGGSRARPTRMPFWRILRGPWKPRRPWRRRLQKSNEFAIYCWKSTWRRDMSDSKSSRVVVCYWIEGIVLSAPARFWERGARCFVGRFS